MAKGSVRKKGKKWYYRFYVEDASGNLVQKEYAGTESKSETEKLLRQAMDDYESKKFVAKTDNLTVGELLDMWAEEELKVGTLSNGTVENYLGAIRCIKKHPIAERKLKTVTAEHLQAFLDLLTFGGEFPDGKVRKGYSKDYIHSFSAVLQQAFRFAVFPKQLITFNPMQYIKLKKQAEDVDLFSDDEVEEGIQPISHEDYERLIEYLKVKNPPAILPIQIAYYAGLRIGDDDDKIRLNQRKPSKYKGLSRFGPEKNLQRINKFMKERPIFYKNLIQMKENFRFYLRCFYCITKVVILQFNSENRTELARNG